MVLSLDLDDIPHYGDCAKRILRGDHGNEVTTAAWLQNQAAAALPQSAVHVVQLGSGVEPDPAAALGNDHLLDSPTRIPDGVVRVAVYAGHAARVSPAGWPVSGLHHSGRRLWPGVLLRLLDGATVGAQLPL